MFGLKKEDRWLLLCAASFLISFGFSTYYGRYVCDYLSVVSARYDKAMVTPLSLEKALQSYGDAIAERIPNVTLWNRREREVVSSKATYRKETVNIIETYGDMSQVIPMKFLYGNYVYLADQKGCVLDSRTAYRLFGTKNAVNNIVVWDKKQYVVRGVAKAKDTMMLIQLSDMQHEYANVEAMYRDRNKGNTADNQRQLMEEMLTQKMGIDQQPVIMDGNLTSDLLYILYHLPIWAIAIELIFVLMRMVYRYRNSLVLFLVLALFTMLTVLFMMKVTNFHMHIPSRYIPTKWSDFEFYVDKYQEIKQDAVMLANCKWMPKDSLRSYMKNSCIIFTSLEMCMLLLIKLQFRYRVNIAKNEV